MGGHGGLNILPQKKWNVYNWDNKLKVEEDIKRAAEAGEAKHEKDTSRNLQSQYEISEHVRIFGFPLISE